MIWQKVPFDLENVGLFFKKTLCIIVNFFKKQSNTVIPGLLFAQKRFGVLVVNE